MTDPTENKDGSAGVQPEPKASQPLRLAKHEAVFKISAKTPPAQKPPAGLIRLIDDPEAGLTPVYPLRKQVTTEERFKVRQVVGESLLQKKQQVIRSDKLKRPPSFPNTAARTSGAAGQSEESKEKEKKAPPSQKPSYAASGAKSTVSASTATPVPRPMHIGHRYRVLECLGRGGMGAVYKAEDRFLGTVVAIKVLKPTMLRDTDSVARFKQEARIAMQLSHSHIVRLHNVEKIGGHYCLIMEYVEGLSLRYVLKKHGRLSMKAVLGILEVTCDAVSYAHRHGVLHNDLKPDNILLTRDGVLKIIDFGTASMVNRPLKNGYIVGTPAYMSPEQVRGECLDVHTDLYALGIMTYEFLTGRTPFGENVTFEDVLENRREPLTGLPEGILRVLNKAIAYQKEERWPDVGAFYQAFMAAAAECESASPT